MLRGKETMHVSFHEKAGRLYMLHLSIELPTSHELSLKERRSAQSSLRLFAPETTDDFRRLRPEVFVTFHLGGTATVTGQVLFNSQADVGGVGPAVDRIWESARHLAEGQRAPFAPVARRDWSTARFSDSLLLDRYDKTSFDRLIRSWGWKAAAPGNVSRPDALSFLAEGRVFGIYVSAEGIAPSGRAVVLETQLSGAGGSATEKRFSLARKSDSRIKIRETSSGTVLTKKVLLEPAVSISRFRSELISFLKGANKLEQREPAPSIR